MKRFLALICVSAVLSAFSIGVGDNFFGSECKIVAPNAFTPNDDGINDVFKPIFTGGCEVNRYNFRIFDRWGRMVFETNEIDAAWDGSYDGQPMKEGAYFWQCSAQFIDRTETKKGSLVLVR